LGDFLDGFDGMRGNNDGIVTWDEWKDYYTDLSASTPSEDYFIAMMESTWQMTENENDKATKETVKMLQTKCKARLLEQSKGGNP
jgi:hypothetical protein